MKAGQGWRWASLISDALSVHLIGFIDLYIDVWDPRRLKAQKRES